MCICVENCLEIIEYVREKWHAKTILVPIKTILVCRMYRSGLHHHFRLSIGVDEVCCFRILGPKQKAYDQVPIFVAIANVLRKDALL